MTRIVVISDTHGRHNELMIPDGDILVHCGDFCTHGQYLDATRFLHWFQTHPHQQKIFIAGNHDLVFEQGSYHDIAMLTEFHLNDSTHYLNDSGINLFGINFWGSPVQPRFFNWAFNRDRGADIKKHWDKIPKDIDVLITHGPPHGICDAAPRGYGLYDQVGCDELLKKVKKIKPSIHLFGHIHFCAGQQVQQEHTLFVNCSICNEQYLPTNKPFVFDIDKDKNISTVNVT
jgi:Icc-related predicted phosphoesterase